MVKINFYNLKNKINWKWFTRRRLNIIGVIALAVLFAFYWQDHRPAPKPHVTVAEVEEKTVPLYLDYISLTESPRIVDIRARVEGFLQKKNFKEGEDVRNNQLLFLIDPKPFEAALKQAKGKLDQDRAALAFAGEQVKRYRPLVEKEYITKEDFDNYVTKEEEARAAVEADEGALKQAQLNLGYCRMYAPFAGRIGRTLVHEGNLVGAAGKDTKLATLVMLDPLYVYFSPSEQEMPKILKYKNEGTLKVSLTFADGTKYPQEGTVDFVNNVVDSKTSTVTMRAVIPNPDKVLLPGVYVESRVNLAEIPNALTIPDKAVAGDQSGSYVLVVDDRDKVEKRSVTLGDQYKEMRIITAGLKAGERVIIDGLQIAKPGTKVHVKVASSVDTVQDAVHQALGLEEKQ